MLGAYGTIVTTDVSVRSECPYCGYENQSPIDDFIETDLWYGQESETCHICKQNYRIDRVERDVG